MRRTSSAGSRLGLNEKNDYTYSTLSVTSYHSDPIKGATPLGPRSYNQGCMFSIVGTFLRALVCDPIPYQGLDIPNLFTGQGIAHIECTRRRHHRTTQSGVYEKSQGWDRLQRTSLILTLRRIRRVSDQVLAPTYMAVHGRTSDVNRGH